MNSKQMRISPDEMATLKSMFANNDSALKLLRKIFLPELDPNAPIGQNLDLWMTIKLEDMSAQDALINIKARNTLIMHVEQCLMQIAGLAGEKSETVEQTKARLTANSTK